MKYKLIVLFSGLIFLCHSQNKIDDYKKIIDSAVVIKKNNYENDHHKKYYLLNSDNTKYNIDNKQAVFFNNSINIYDKKNKKILKKGVYVWKIIPELTKNQLTVKIIDFRVFYKNNNYEFINNGGSIVVFEYSCSENVWKLLSEKHFGI